MENEKKPIIKICKSGGSRGKYYFDIRYTYIGATTSSYLRTVVKKELMKCIITDIIGIIQKGVGGTYNTCDITFEFHKDGTCEVIVRSAYHDLSEWVTSEEILRIMKDARRIVNNTK